MTARKALRETMSELPGKDGLERVAAMMSGLDIITASAKDTIVVSRGADDPRLIPELLPTTSDPHLPPPPPPPPPPSPPPPPPPLRCSDAAFPISAWSPPTRPLRAFTLLHDARPVLLNLGEPGGFDITPWADRVQLVDAKYVGSWELPALGPVTASTAVLIRPDGYVAWVGT